jgi:hypothetical protein
LPALLSPDFSPFSGFGLSAEAAETAAERQAHPKAVRVTFSQNLLRVMFFSLKEVMPSPLSNRTAE